EIGHVGAGVALGIQELTVLDREIRNRFHVYSNGRSRGARGRYRCWAAADGAALYIRVPGLAGARATTIVVARARIRAHPGGKSAYNACTSLQKNASHETARTRAHDPQAPGSGQRLLGLPEARPAAPGAGAAQRSPASRRDAVHHPAPGGGAVDQARHPRDRGRDPVLTAGRSSPRGEALRAREAHPEPALQPVDGARYAHAERIRAVPRQPREGLPLPHTRPPAPPA